MAEKTVLWTGGWDSTFRVLDLIINKELAVKPIYLIDKDRRGCQLELESMEKIRHRVAFEYPRAAERLHPLEICCRHDIPDNTAIACAYAAVGKKQQLGTQYDWLARFCDYRGLYSVDLSIEQDARERRVPSGARAAFEALVVPVTTEAETTYVVSPEQAGQAEYQLFRYFTFPLLYTTKLEMAELAADSGFRDILEISWFCHAPINERACGRCGPCRFTIQNGMGYRLPLVARYVRYPMRLVETWLENSLPNSAVITLKKLKSSL